jgi:hypothetical protein
LAAYYAGQPKRNPDPATLGELPESIVRLVELGDPIPGRRQTFNDCAAGVTGFEPGNVAVRSGGRPDAVSGSADRDVSNGLRSLRCH